MQKSRVLLVGCGSLGTVNGEFLARAGVGYLRIVDGDQVELPNLHRQFLFSEGDAEAGVLKVFAARDRINEINSEIMVDIHDRHLTEENMAELTEEIELIIDCTDNYKARRLIDRIALKREIPWIYGGVAGSMGTVKFVASDRGESIADIFKGDEGAAPVTTCRNGVINTAPGIVACLQTTEALKYLTGHRKDINKGYIFFDLWQNQWEGFGS